MGGLLRDIEPRLYQETIFATCTLKNCLVVLPTGLGKTAIGLMVAAHRLHQYPKSKIIFLAPTKPLAQQHLQTFKKHLALPEEKFALFTGDIPPDERTAVWPNVQLIFSTPQGLENDVLGSKISLEDVSLIIFDEAHRAVGNYSYVFVAKQYAQKAKYARILGLTASPGAELEHINEVCKNLFIEDVEVRTPKDNDVAPYVQDIEVTWVKVELTPELQRVQKFLQDCFAQRVAALKKFGLKTGRFLSKKDLLLLQKDLHGRISSGERDFDTLKTISLLAEAIKVQHALEMIETQGVAPTYKYMQKLFEEAPSTKVKAVKNLVQDLNFKSAWLVTQNLLANKIEHPKLAKLKTIITEEVAKNKLVKIILFTHFRDSAVRAKEELMQIPHVVPSVFVGQTKKGETGLTQKQQIEMLDQFRDGLFNVLIATSVAEEGLDIPRVDLVVFYEPIPSAIRQIQRRGRTGRQERGRVIILMTKGTRDEAFQWSAVRKEKTMHHLLHTMRDDLKKHLQPKQATIQAFTQSSTVIFADYREKAGGVVKELAEMGAQLKLEMLNTADYILSARVGVEFKTVEDFVSSIIDGRLLEQLKHLKQNFARPIIVLEGEQDIFAVRNVHPNAIRGMLATIAVSYGIPILRTKDAKDSAALLYAIAKREQDEDKTDFSPHTSKKPMSINEAQEYIISAFPNVGPQLAKELLKYFKTIKNFVNASEEELQKVEGVGDKKAKGIKDVNEKEY